MIEKKEKKREANNLKKSLDELRSIADWFDGQEEVDVEQGLEKAKKGVKLVKECRRRLAELENEFEEIKKEL